MTLLKNICKKIFHKDQKERKFINQNRVKYYANPIFFCQFRKYFSHLLSDCKFLN